MADPAEEIDRLYQLPLDEFTPARNALAKERGKTDARIKNLQKPNMPAWAVNQLYWRERPLYDRLIKASDRLRVEHRKLLGGKSADIREAENAHRDLLRQASEKVRSILRDAGQAVTPATLTAVAETLEALPTSDSPGRLTRPLKRMGFEALAGVPLRPSAGSQAPRDGAGRAALKIVPKRDDPKEKERQQRALKEQREAEAAVKRAEAAVAKAEQDVSRKEETLAAAVKARDRLRKELSDAISEHQRATLRVRE
jgi:hypothetical protein